MNYTNNAIKLLKEKKIQVNLTENHKHDYLTKIWSNNVCALKPKLCNYQFAQPNVRVGQSYKCQEHACQKPHTVGLVNNAEQAKRAPTFAHLADLHLMDQSTWHSSHDPHDCTPYSFGVVGPVASPHWASHNHGYWLQRLTISDLDIRNNNTPLNNGAFHSHKYGHFFLSILCLFPYRLVPITDLSIEELLIEIPLVSLTPRCSSLFCK